MIDTFCAILTQNKRLYVEIWTAVTPWLTRRQLWNTDISDFGGEKRISRLLLPQPGRSLLSWNINLKTVQQKITCRKEWSDTALRLKMTQKKTERTWTWQCWQEGLHICGRFLLMLKAFLVGSPSKSQSGPADRQWIVFDGTTSHILHRPLHWSHCSQWKLLDRGCTPQQSFRT